MALMLHCGSQSATREQLYEVEVPEATDSWYPLGYERVLEIVDGAIDETDYNITDQGFGLNRKGKQMFGVISLSHETEETDLALGLRQSLDKSLALGVAVGARVFVCDNLCFDGDSFTTVRKNTRFIDRDFSNLISQALANATVNFEAITNQNNEWKGLPVGLEEGYELIGLALGREILKPTIASKAIRTWRKPEHEEFEERTAWSFYNALTHAVKSVRPGILIDEHIAVRNFVKQVM